MTPTRILLVNAVNPYVEAQNRYPALGLGYLIATLRSEFGPRLELLLVEDEVEETIRTWKPDLLALSSVSQNYTLALAYASLGREAGIPVIIGGYHITELPSSLSPDMDVGVIGEGERAICDLVEIFLENRALPAAKLAGVPGIVYWSDGERSTTSPREVIGKSSRSLDELPMPDRSMMRVRPRSCANRSSLAACRRLLSVR